MAAVFVLRLPKTGFTLLGAALLFGLAGYALQGSPGAPAAPASTAAADTQQIGELVVEARREFFDTALLPSRFVITSDAYARRGDHERAAAFAESAVEENPNDIEAWTALGNALTEHAGGQLTPLPRLYAYGQAERRAPAHPRPAYFLGWRCSHRPTRAHPGDLVRNSRPGAGRCPWRAGAGGAVGASGCAGGAGPAAVMSPVETDWPRAAGALRAPCHAATRAACVRRVVRAAGTST